MVHGTIVQILYLLSAVLFIYGIKGLTRVRTARRGNLLASTAMLVAVVATLLGMGVVDYRWIIAGIVIGGGIGAVAAVKVRMTSMPEMVAILNGCGGIASSLVALSVVWTESVEPDTVGTLADVLGGSSALTVGLSILVGGLTFSGSLIAYAKLAGKMRGEPTPLSAWAWPSPRPWSKSSPTCRRAIPSSSSSASSVTTTCRSSAPS
jgi:NAD(P) transhydrogenase subunit beta